MKEYTQIRSVRTVSLLLAAVLVGFLGVRIALAEGQSTALPAPAVDLPKAKGAVQNAVFSGGCFWGIQGVFQHVKGVTSAVSGYAGGDAKTAEYEVVSTGTTGHAESVRVTFDPSQVSYGELLKIFFSVAHDPTQLNRQGPDSGTQYRSAIWVTNDDQKHVAQAYIVQLTAAKAYARPIVTEVNALPAFYPAEAYHQDYLRLHPTQPYIVFNDLPKIAALKSTFPTEYHD